MFHSLWPLLCVSQNDSVAESNDDVPLESLNTLLTDISLVSSAGRHGSCYGLIKMERMAGKVMRVGEKNCKIKWDGRRRTGDLRDVRRLHILGWGSCAKREWEIEKQSSSLSSCFICWSLFATCSSPASPSLQEEIAYTCFEKIRFWSNVKSTRLICCMRQKREVRAHFWGYLQHKSFFYISFTKTVCLLILFCHSFAWVAHASVLVISLFSLSFSTFTLTWTPECW